MTEEIQNDVPVCPEPTPPTPTPAPSSDLAPTSRKRGSYKTDPRTGERYKQTQAERQKDAKRKKEKRVERAAIRRAEQEALAKNDYTDPSVLNEEQKRQILKDEWQVSASRLPLILTLADEAASQLRYTQNRFFYAHGPRQMARSIEAKVPRQIEHIQNRDDHFLQDNYADWFAIFHFSVAWRHPEISFDEYLAGLQSFCDDFFVANGWLEKDFTPDPYQEWVELFPKLDSRKLPSRYTQQQYRRFLDDTREASGGFNQRLLIAPRASMKSWFCKVWTVQALTICPDLRIWTISETLPLSRAWVAELRSMLEVAPGNRTKYQYMFPQYCIATGEGSIKEFHSPVARLNFAVGVASSAMEATGQTGFRSDLQFFDDPTSGDSLTEEAIRKTWAKYLAMRKLLEAGSALGSVTCLTPWSIDPPDLGARLLELDDEARKEGDDAFLKYSVSPVFSVKDHAVEKAKQNLLLLEESDVVIRYPRFSWKSLRKSMQESRENNYQFFRAQLLCEYGCLADDSMRCTFTEADLEKATHPLSYFQPEIDTCVFDNVLSIDVAYSTAKTADFSALALMTFFKKDNRNICAVRNCEVTRLKISELAVRIVETLHNNPNVRKVIAERTGAWETLAAEIKKAAMLRGYIIPPIYWRPVNQWSAKDKVLRIKSTCEVMLNDGRLQFVAGPYTPQLFRQFVDFEGEATVRNYRRKSDGPDAIASGLDAAFPGIERGLKSEEGDDDEQRQHEAAHRQAMHDMVFGNNPVYRPTASTPDTSTNYMETPTGWKIPFGHRRPNPAPTQSPDFSGLNRWTGKKL